MTRSLFRDSRRPYFWAERKLLHMGFGPTEIAVYCVLADCVNSAGHCWPTYQTVAGRLGICRRTAMRAVQRLCVGHAIRKSRVIDPKRGNQANLYELFDLSGSGAEVCQTSPPGDSPDTTLVTPVSPPWCQKVPTNKEPVNKDKECNPDLVSAEAVGSRSEGVALNDAELRRQMRAGNSLGRKIFQELVGPFPPDGQTRRLIYDGLAKDENDARDIIAACTERA